MKKMIGLLSLIAVMQVNAGTLADLFPGLEEVYQADPAVQEPIKDFLKAIYPKLDVAEKKEVEEVCQKVFGQDKAPARFTPAIDKALADVEAKKGDAGLQDKAAEEITKEYIRGKPYAAAAAKGMGL